MIQLPSMKDIKALEEGRIPLSLAGTPFCIIRESVTVPFLTECSWAWNIFLSPRREDSVEIPRDSAKRIVRNLGMSVSYRSQYGQIYETPGNPFQQKFRRERRSKKTKS